MASRIDIENVKGRASVAGEAVREFAGDRWTDFRRESVYFQLKAGLIAGYVLLTIVTLYLMIPTPPDFEHKILRVDFGISDRIGIEIVNTRMGDIENATVVVEGARTSLEGARVPGKWSAPVSALRDGEKVTVMPGEFRDEKNLRINYSIDVDRILIYEEGKLRGKVKVKKDN